MPKSGTLRIFYHLVKRVILALIIFTTTAPNLHANPMMPDRYNAVTITNVIILAAPPGGNSALRFRLVNESAETLVLIGVTSEYISGAKILAQTRHKTPAGLGSISIRPEETLDLHSSHLKILLTGLKKGFLQGQIVPLTLDMSRGRIPIHAHVH